MRFKPFLTICTSLVALVVLGSALAAPAAASTLWGRHTYGSHAWGYVSKSNGYIYDRYTVKDNRPDGDCAYIESISATFNDTPYGGVWVTGFHTHRHEVCGNGNRKSGTDTWNIADSIIPTSQKIRIETRACRDINNHTDNCSGWYLSQSWDV